MLNKRESTLVQYPMRKAGAYVVPNGITQIGRAAFWGCLGLTSVDIPASVTYIGEVAFCACRNNARRVAPCWEGERPREPPAHAVMQRARRHHPHFLASASRLEPDRGLHYDGPHA